MKSFVLTLLLTFYATTAVLSQDTQTPSVLVANADWPKEVITFPVDWAPLVQLEGFEELRFSPQWSNKDSDQFWSLVIAWQVKASAELDIQTIEQNFEGYFNGLMKPNHWATTFPDPVVLFIPNPDTNTNQSFIGKMKFFDGFHTGKVQTLTISVEQHFCSTSLTSTIIFRCSPKPFEHAVWKDLNAVTRQPDTCQ